MPTQIDAMKSSGPVTAGAVCKSCQSQDLTPFYQTDSVPVNSCLLLSDGDSARRYPTGQISLVFCRQCGFIGNERFNPELTRYTNAYEEQQSFSPRFNAFSQELAADLVDRWGLKGKTVLEIGCGKGDFLVQLCELGAGHCIGIDPTYVEGRHDERLKSRLTFIQDFYSEKHGDYNADFVCCRHTLEHIPDTAAFMQTVRQALGDRSDTIIFFELPDISRVLDESAFWDIYYEHCSYFSLGSLARLFRATGFDVLDLGKAYDGQYLLLEAKPSAGTSAPPLKEENDLEELSDSVARFTANHSRHVADWKQRIEAWQQNNARVAVWGSGSKCVAFLSTLGIKDEIEFVVDINPHRQGKYLPGSGKRIVAPSELKGYRPDVVVAMNPIYLDEIRGDLRAMGLDPELIAV
jgi:SAM-dependent methyltransferase